MTLSSPFTSKFGTNYGAADEEIAQIHEIIREPRRRLQSLDDELANLQRTIDRLTGERGALAAFIDGHNALLSPIRRLPREILQEVFCACLPTHRNCVMSATEPPILLGRVCSAWRIISLSTPRLWSRLHVVEPNIRSHFRLASDNAQALLQEKLAQRRAVTETWLSRSGKCGLSITVQSAAQLSSNATQSPIIQVLLPFASRWEHIGFTANNEVLANLPPFDIDSDLPMLKSLAINERQTTQPSTMWDTLSLCGAPQLSSFSASGICFRPMELPLRWERLEKLSLRKHRGSPDSKLSSETALQVLSLCPVLRSFGVLVHDRTHVASQHAPGVLTPTHRSLRTLDVRCSGSLTSIARTFCGAILLPELQELLFDGSAADRGDGITGPSYGSFFQSSPKITSIQVMLDMFTKLSLVEFIRCLPGSINKLTVLTTAPWNSDHQLFDHSILSMLAAAPPSSPFSAVVGSNLQDLTIVGIPSVSDEMLRDFITARMSSTAHRKLRRIVVRFSREIELDIMPDLKKFVDEGLYVNLTYFEEPRLLASPWDGLVEAIPLEP